MQNCIAVDTFDAVEIRWAPNDYYIIVCDSSLNYKFCVVCPFNGIVHRYEAYEYGLGIKSIDYSPNSSFLAVGSYDEKVRLFNTLSWKLIIEW